MVFIRMKRMAPFVVYKNGADGKRMVRYKGDDESLCRKRAVYEDEGAGCYPEGRAESSER